MDLLIINSVPSFYKISLYNQISKIIDIHVIFIGLTDQVVNDDNFEDTIEFSYELLNQDHKSRSVFFTFLKLFRFILSNNIKKVVFGGYLESEMKILPFLTPRGKNCLQFESSINDSVCVGLKGFIKRILFSRYSIGLYSGELQLEVFRRLNFKGKLVTTNGVGLIKRNSRGLSSGIIKNQEFKYLYVGRLVQVKNLDFLIAEFNKSGRSLSIVGSGELSERLKSLAKSNVTFFDFVPNAKLSDLYSNHDILVLPSISEVWGLVVEEAIYNNLPVIVSDHVGCFKDLVERPKTGEVFKFNDSLSLERGINLLENNFAHYYNNCREFNFDTYQLRQIEAYLSILEV
jgi:glycosyltransferase involved in cell wall biosynthesis